MALLFTVLCGAVALTLGYFINFFAKGHFVQSTEAIIESEIRYVDSIDAPLNTLNHDNRLYWPLDDSGRLPKDIIISQGRLAEGLLLFRQTETQNYYAARVHTMPDGQKILIGTDITEISEDYQFMQWIGLASIAFVMIVVFISYLISIFVVRGTNKIADTAFDIMRTGDLTRRVEVASNWDDLSNMAETLNLLLDRIEALLNGVRHVADNIAHDLRTPLTRMRNHIEDLQKQQPDSAAIQEILGEADNLLQTFNALLRIARIETEQQRSHFATLSLRNLVQDVVEFYLPLAEEKSVTITKNIEAASLKGDKDLLFQAYANILDNAVKFTPEGGTIHITLQQEAGKIRLSVQNSGEGIGDDAPEDIFKRFYRTEKSRHIAGSGLGLALVAAVIHLHDGEIIARNVPDGFEIITIL